MKTNPMMEMRKLGQSLWLDNINRALMKSGKLQRLIEEGLTGVTSNPTIFEKAFGSGDYDEEIARRVSRGETVRRIADALMIEDIQLAADLFQTVYEESGGNDGFVSIELDPSLAHRTEASIGAAKALPPRLKRKNVMIKVPGTAEGIPAIEALTAEGISVNVTLVFSLEQYEKAARAYLAGAERRLRRGGSLGSVRSVNSLFISRIDTAVDRLLEEKIQAAGSEQERGALRALLGKAGIANAKLAYQKFKALFQGPEFRALQEEGVPLQRLLWGSTGTKNPNYPDLLYVENLIGPETINTVPPATLEAFKDHGSVRPTLEGDLDGARETLEKLARLGIDLQRVTATLQEEGVKSFSESFEKMVARLDEKRQDLLAKKKIA